MSNKDMTAAEYLQRSIATRMNTIYLAYGIKLSESSKSKQGKHGSSGQLKEKGSSEGRASKKVER